MNEDYIQEERAKVIRQSDIMDKVKEWLKGQVKNTQEFVDAQENGEDWVTSDGSDDIYIGWNECSESLLEKISEWENENDG